MVLNFSTEKNQDIDDKRNVSPQLAFKIYGTGEQFY